MYDSSLTSASSVSCEVTLGSADDFSNVPSCDLAKIPGPPKPLDLVPIVVPSVVVPVVLIVGSYAGYRWISFRRQKLRKARAQFSQFIRRRARQVSAFDEEEFDAVGPAPASPGEYQPPPGLPPIRRMQRPKRSRLMF